ncbi:hypothetical protein NN561_005251 [Cricetulus griseus]
MRPSGTTGTVLLLLLAAFYAPGGALEEKKGKGVSRRPAPPAESARLALAVGAGVRVPSLPPFLSCLSEDRLGPWEEWDVLCLEWSRLGLPKEGRSGWGQRGCQRSVGTAVVRSGDSRLLPT